MTFLSSFFSYVQNEEPKPEPESTAVATRNDAPEPEPAAESTPTDEEPAEEEEEEEPEDVLPQLREKCAESKDCSKLNEHFLHCTEKVTDGHGFKGEDCVEELFHLMHCVDACVAPKLFSKLK